MNHIVHTNSNANWIVMLVYIRFLFCKPNTTPLLLGEWNNRLRYQYIKLHVHLYTSIFKNLAGFTIKLQIIVFIFSLMHIIAVSIITVGSNWHCHFTIQECQNKSGKYCDMRFLILSPIHDVMWRLYTSPVWHLNKKLFFFILFFKYLGEICENTLQPVIFLWTELTDRISY